MVCSICGSSFDPEHSTDLPFCSFRCKEIDLGRWLDERYSLPIERDPEESPADPEAE
jgi:endogenous inhibitor of DNA gyrase (YacG/DUF329 family)